MSIKNLLASLLVSGALLSGCASTGESQTAAAEVNPLQQEYEQAMSAAKAAQKQAASVGGEWRDTGKILKQAEQSAKTGDYEKAIKLCNKAKFQGEVGYEQAMSQKSAGPRF